MGRRIWWVIHSYMQTLAARIPIIYLLTSRPWDGNIAILFLASKEAGWITGLIMPVDGGVSPPPLFLVIIAKLFVGHRLKRKRADIIPCL